MKKSTLKVYSNNVMLNVWFIAFLPLLALILPFALFGISADEPLGLIILFSFLMLIASTYLIINALYMIQRVKLSEHGIIIYSLLFSTIKAIKWSELIDLRTESVVTFSTAYGQCFSQDWIVIYTDPSQKGKERKPYNRKKAGPWYIIGTSENITILAEYVNKYAPHISVDPDLLF